MQVMSRAHGCAGAHNRCVSMDAYRDAGGRATQDDGQDVQVSRLHGCRRATDKRKQSSKRSNHNQRRLIHMR